jgi:hypothetical protein
MNYHVTPEGVSAALALTFFFWMFLWQWFSSEKLRKTIVMFGLLLLLLVLTFVCWYHQKSFLLATLPWLYLLSTGAMLLTKALAGSPMSYVETDYD